ncbi:MAG TPA: sugar phosphate isomerase/epimerase [Terriglobales bacterium]|nr:sugar phosphate isomerase/epimerase [Terriglobales bacterium]
MSSSYSRREFLGGAMAAAALAALPSPALAAFEPLYPPMDLSYFDTPVSAAPAEIKFGYAAITWGGDDRKAIEDISALGYSGIQIRSNAVKEFPNPAELRDLLQQHHLTMVALSSGDVSVETDEAAEIAKHAANAKYAHDAGSLYLQAIDAKPKRDITADDFKTLGRRLTEIGKRSADLGVKLGYHNHMGTIGQAPDEVDRVLAASDPRYVKFELDIAHYLQGGGDPVKAIQKYRDRLLFMHIKDVESIPKEQSSRGRDFRFVELGRGRVDVPGTFKALHDVGFRGWAIVELDVVPDPSRSPKEAALISKSYLHDRLGFAI